VSARLTVYVEGRTVHAFDLNMPVLAIGRSPDSGLPLPDPAVSRQHAELRQTAEGVTLTDLGSDNGTLLGDTRILPHQPYLLASGTTFSIGSYGFLFEQAGVAPPGAPEGDGTPPEEEAGVPDGAPSGTPAEAPGEAPEPAAVLEEVQRHVSLPPPAPPPPPRPVWPAPLPAGPLSGYLRDLPLIFQDSDFLGRYLLILEAIWEPLEQRQDHLDFYFDPRTCPPSFLPWLATWLDPALDTRWPEERLRQVLARAIDLFRWRGTRYGLSRMIELCTGVAPRVSDEPDTPFAFRVQVEVPPEMGVDVRLLEGLIQAQKPAHAGYVLEVTAAAP
jgi:phage tail-like protein